MQPCTLRRIGSQTAAWSGTPGRPCASSCSCGLLFDGSSGRRIAGLGTGWMQMKPVSSEEPETIDHFVVSCTNHRPHRRFLQLHQAGMVEHSLRDRTPARLTEL